MVNGDCLFEEEEVLVEVLDEEVGLKHDEEGIVDLEKTQHNGQPQGEQDENKQNEDKQEEKTVEVGRCLNQPPSIFHPSIQYTFNKEYDATNYSYVFVFRIEINGQFMG